MRPLPPQLLQLTRLSPPQAEQFCSTFPEPRQSEQVPESFPSPPQRLQGLGVAVGFGVDLGVAVGFGVAVGLGAAVALLVGLGVLPASVPLCSSSF